MGRRGRMGEDGGGLVFRREGEGGLGRCEMLRCCDCSSCCAIAVLIYLLCVCCVSDLPATTVRALR